MKKQNKEIPIRMEKSPSAFHSLEQSLRNMDLKLSLHLAYTQGTDELHRSRYIEIKNRVQICLPNRDFSSGLSDDDFKLLEATKEELGEEYPALEALFNLCAAEHMLSLGHREIAWACLYLVQNALVDAERRIVISKNEMKRQEVGGMKKSAADKECLAYAALLIRELARVRKSPWASRKEAIDEVHPLMEAFVGAYRNTTKKPTLRKDLGEWITKVPEVTAAFRATCAPGTLTEGE